MGEVILERASRLLLLQILFVAFLLVISRLPRFGRMVPLDKEDRPPARDTVIAVAGLYQTSGAARHAAEIIGNRLAEVRAVLAAGDESRGAPEALLKAERMYERVRAMGKKTTEGDLVRFAAEVVELLEEAGLTGASTVPHGQKHRRKNK